MGRSSFRCAFNWTQRYNYGMPYVSKLHTLQLYNGVSGDQYSHQVILQFDQVILQFDQVIFYVPPSDTSGSSTVWSSDILCSSGIIILVILSQAISYTTILIGSNLPSSDYFLLQVKTHYQITSSTILPFGKDLAPATCARALDLPQLHGVVFSWVFCYWLV